MSEPIVAKAGVDRYEAAVVAVIFGLLFVGWVVVMLLLLLLFLALGGGWRDLVSAVNPMNQRPGDWWFYWCIEVIPPLGIGAGLVLAIRRRWLLALSVIPGVIAFEAVGSTIVYYIDRLLL